MVTGIRAQKNVSPHSRHEVDLRKPFSILIFGLLGSVLLLSSGMVSAGEKSAFSESAYLDEMPVVLSVSRLSQRVDEAPAAVTIIDRQMVRDSGAWDLAELFRLVPGMYVAYHATSVYTTNSTVSYHGLSDAYAHRMQVLVDGRSVYSPLFGGVLWDDIPLALDDIERIEVIRGPNSASYGANSFLGVINITTRHSAETQGKFLSLSVGRGHGETVARYGGGDGDFTWRMTAGLRNDSGEEARIFGPIKNDARHGANKQDDKRIRQLTLRADYRLDVRDELELQFGYNGGMREEGFGTDTFATRQKQVANHFQLVHWRRHLDAGGELSVQFYHGYEESRDTLYAMPPYTGLSFDAGVEAHRYDLEVQHIFSPSDATRLVWGGSVRLDSTYWPLYLNRQDSFDFHLARLFGNLEWRVKPELVVNLGAMAENNDFTGTDITPRAALNWHFSPGHTLRASHSRATRTPTLYEQKVDNRYRVPLPIPYDHIARYAVGGLKPERIKSTEIGYIGKISRLDADLRLFRDELSDLISPRNYNPCNPTGMLPTLGGFVLPPDVPAGLTAPGVACYGVDALSSINSGSAVIKGFEMQLQWRPGERTRLIYGLSRAIVSSPNENEQPYTSSVPTNSHSLMLAHSLDERLSGSLTGYHVGEVRALGGVERVDAYQRWDGRLAHRFRSGGGNGELALVVQNLFDGRYFEYEAVNQPPGRTTWLNLKLDL
jgi:iron complex outermembrane receptor protein